MLPKKLKNSYMLNDYFICSIIIVISPFDFKIIGALKFLYFILFLIYIPLIKIVKMLINTHALTQKTFVFYAILDCDLCIVYPYFRTIAYICHDRMQH